MKKELKEYIERRVAGILEYSKEIRTMQGDTRKTYMDIKRCLTKLGEYISLVAEFYPKDTELKEKANQAMFQLLYMSSEVADSLSKR